MLKAFKLPEVRKKIFFSLLVIVIFRFLAHIPVPGVNISAIRSYLESSALLGVYNLFSGGAFQNFSIVTLGVGPYINASIIIQLFTMMIPSLEELQKEGEYGREKINMYTKILAIPIALLQGYGIYFLLSRQGIIQSLNFFNTLVLVFSLLAGTMFLTWIGDLVTEYGIGNGISILIFVGIISRLPATVMQLATGVISGNWELILNIGLYLLLSLIVILGVVLVNEGTRNIALEYGRRGTRSSKVTNYLPIKINQAGVIPIIFAVAAVSLPSVVSGPLMATSNETLQKIGTFLSTGFSQDTIAYNIFYFLLVFGFTYFYTSIQFDPEKIADDIKKRGGFIPGIRPGKNTSDYLKKVITRITLIGAVFLGVIAILPFLVRNYVGFAGLTIGGTGLLIVVSVILETVRQIESQLVTRDYTNFLR